MLPKRQQKRKIGQKSAVNVTKKATFIGPGTIELRGDKQIKDESDPWSPTASSRLLRCFIADAIKNKTQIF